MTLAAERPDIPADIEPGLTEHLVAEYIRDLRRMTSFERMREFVAECVLRESMPRRFYEIQNERRQQ